MTRRVPEMTPEEVKAAADRAEGVKPEPEASRGGRPPKYQASYADQAGKLCALGATDEDLAEFFEVSIRTIANWKARHEGFLQALNGGKEKADDRVERSLYQRAVGYSYDAVHFSSYQGAVTSTPYREHCPPDVTAQIFWLKNRRKDEWRDKHDHSLSNPDGSPIVFQTIFESKPER